MHRRPVPARVLAVQELRRSGATRPRDARHRARPTERARAIRAALKGE